MPANPEILILVLDDNPADVFLIREALRREPVRHRIVEFEDGESALKYLTAIREVPDLAILDLNVPKRDGSEVLAAIRMHPSLQQMTVVILSSSPRDVMKSRVTQADCYIEKPSGLEAFLALGKQILSCHFEIRSRT